MSILAGNEAPGFSSEPLDMNVTLRGFYGPGLAFHPPIEPRPYMLSLLQFCK
jgi:hypothetical protein